MLCSTNMWSFTSGTTVQYKRPLDINERWSLVGQTNNSSYYTTNIALSEPTFIIISAVRDGSGGPTYFDCTITITKDEDNSYAHVLSQNALNIDGGINLKVAYYNNSGTKTVLDQIKYSSHIVWGRNYPCKIYGVNYAVGLSTALGGPYGSTTSKPTDLYTVSYTNSTAVPLNPLQSAYFGVKRVR